jgi:hypothetical protein
MMSNDRLEREPRPRRRLSTSRVAMAMVLCTGLGLGACSEERGVQSAAAPPDAVPSLRADDGLPGRDPAGGSASGGREDLSAAALLFGEAPEELPERARREIVDGLGIRADPGGSVLLDDVCGAPIQAAVQVRDLNGDGRAEVMVVVESLCLYGGTGAGTTLFVLDEEGSYRPNLGFPGHVVEVLDRRRDGFPDLLVGGMSDCFAVWGWNGRAYEHLRNEPQRRGGCDFLPA